MSQGGYPADAQLVRLHDTIRDMERSIVQLETKQQMHDQQVQTWSGKVENAGNNILNLQATHRNIEDALTGLRTYNETLRNQLQAAFGSSSSMQTFSDKITTLTTEYKDMILRLNECESKVAEHLTTTPHIEQRQRESVASLREEINAIDDRCGELSDTVEELKDNVSEFRTIITTIKAILGFIVAFITIVATLQSLGIFEAIKK